MRYHTPPSTLAHRVTLLKAHLDQIVGPAKRWRQPTAVASEKSLAMARKLARPAAPPHLDDAGWVAVFRETHRLLSHLYGDKTHVEIVRYLSHVELNLALAGYAVARELIEDQFGKLFSRLDLQPAKGRDPHKFVSLQDVSGTRDSFVLLKLGYEDE